MKVFAFVTLCAVVSAVPNVQVNIFSESLWPGCKNYITQEVASAFSEVPDIMDLMVYAYGNAQETKNSDGTWKYTCQHGKDECDGNILEACAISLYNKTAQWFPFVNCIEEADDAPSKVAAGCAKKAGLDYTAIAKLAASRQGNQIMHEVATTTNNLNPPHQFTPWVTMNGKPLTSKQLDDHLVKLVCQAYTGTKPKACNKYLRSIQLCQRNVTNNH